MSLTNRNPLRMAGANLNSGSVNTGDMPVTQGGAQRWGFYSGGPLSPGSGSPNPPAGAVVKTADQVLIYSGAGRLNMVIPHVEASGVRTVFYDSAVVAVSGPNTFANSGFAIVGVVPANTFLANGTLGGPIPIYFGTPFNSGLCVAASSGTPGCTVTFTPETNPINPGN